MSRNYFYIIVAAAIFCLFLIFVSLWKEIDTPTTKDPVIPPPTAPYQTYISGVGIVEPSSDNINISTTLNRVISKIFVDVGSKVKKGDPLFVLENRDLKANFYVQKIAYKSALAKLQKLEAMPRQEDLEAAQAVLSTAEVDLELARKQYEMVQALPDQRALSQEEKNRRLFNYKQAEVKWHQAQASFNKVKEGAWEHDLEIARLGVSEAKANVNLVSTEIQRTVIRSPIDGTVLQIKVHEGEFPSIDPSRMPIMILGNIDEMYLRVSINQLDIPFFNPGCPAVAFLQGDSKMEFPLEFVRIEPYLVNKQNLTNEISERVDTRVLQILYRIKTSDPHIYVGQRMDVFIKYR